MILFSVILGLLIVGLIVLLLNIKPGKKVQCKIVKAGNISKVTKLTATINNLDNKSFVHEGEKLDLTKYEIFVVDGESMAKKDIHTGNGLLVAKLYGEEKLGLSGTPLIVFEIDKDRRQFRHPGEELSDLSEYKLREFVAYIRNREELKDVIQRLAALQGSSSLKEEETIWQKYEKAVDFYKDSIPLIMSFTYPDEQQNYSFHHPRFLIGKVEYVIPKGVIQL